MLLRVSAFSVPKAGLTPDQNEDAYAADPAGRFAVADGASEGWQSGAWAQLLAAEYTRLPPTPDTFNDWLTGCRQRFAAAAVPTPAAWYAEAKQEQGAFATLAGLTLARAADGGLKWRAVAVGDSCLFRVRGGVLRNTFPVESAAGFGNRPKLIASAVEPCEPEWFAGRADPGDVFYLLTDALAEWAFGAENPWPALDWGLANAAAFADFVQTLRAAREARNDDATAARIRAGRPEDAS